jgi:hypothetical protein
VEQDCGHWEKRAAVALERLSANGKFELLDFGVQFDTVVRV